jgi:hypothetical protein
MGLRLLIRGWQFCSFQRHSPTVVIALALILPAQNHGAAFGTPRQAVGVGLPGPRANTTLPRWLTEATKRAIANDDYASLTLGVSLNESLTGADLQAQRAELQKLSKEFSATRPSVNIFEQSLQLREFIAQKPSTPATKNVLQILARQLDVRGVGAVGIPGVDLRDDVGLRGQLEARALLSLLQLGDQLTQRADLAAVASEIAGVSRDASDVLSRISAPDALLSLIPGFNAQVGTTYELARTLIQHLNGTVRGEVAQTVEGFKNTATAKTTAFSEKTWNDAMTALAIGSYWLSQSDPEAARALMQVGRLAEQAWTLGKALSSISAEDWASYGGAVMAGGYVAIAIIAVNELYKTQQPSAEELMFAELLEIKRMLVHLEELINRRFNRIEDLMASYHEEQVRLLKAILSITIDNSAQLEAVRTGMTELKAEIRAIRDDIEEDSLAKYHNDYIQQSASCAGQRLSQDRLRACIGFYYAVAVGWSASPPFLEKSAITPRSRALAEEPMTHVRALLAIPAAGGLTPLRAPHHPAVWMNGAVPLLELLETYPTARTMLNAARARALIDSGTDIVRFRERLGDSRLESTELSNALSREYFAATERLAQTLKREAASTLALQQIRGVDLLEPRYFTWGADAGDDVVEAAMPAVMRDCTWGDTKAGELPVPRGVASLMNPLIKLANKLDPKGHALEICFQLWTSNPRVYRMLNESRFLPNFRYMNRYKLAVFYRTPGVRDGHWYNVQKDIGDFATWLTPVNGPLPDHAAYKFMGDIPLGGAVEGDAAPGLFAMGAIRKFAGSDAFKEFSKGADVGGRYEDGGLYITRDGVAYDRGSKLEEFVRERLIDLAVAFVGRVSNEATKESPTRSALARISEVRAQAIGWLQLLRPTPALREASVHRAILQEGPALDLSDELNRLIEPHVSQGGCTTRSLLPQSGEASDARKRQQQIGCILLRLADGDPYYTNEGNFAIQRALDEALARRTAGRVQFREYGGFLGRDGSLDRAEVAITITKLSEALRVGPNQH